MMWFLADAVTQVTIQQDPVDQWIARVRDVGIPFSICALILWFLWKYGPKLAEAHIDTLTTVRTTQKTQSDTFKEHTNALKQIGDNSERLAEQSEKLTQLNAVQTKTMEAMCKTDMDHMSEHQRTQKAIQYLAEARVLECNNPAARTLIDKAIAVVKREDLLGRAG